MPPFLPSLLVAAALTALTFVAGYPLDLGGGRRVDALDAFLLAFALINLRLAWSGATHGPGRAPGWFLPAGLLVAALITYRMFSALTAAP